MYEGSQSLSSLRTRRDHDPALFYLLGHIPSIYVKNLPVHNALLCVRTM